MVLGPFSPPRRPLSPSHQLPETLAQTLFNVLLLPWAPQATSNGCHFTGQKVFHTAVLKNISPVKRILLPGFAYFLITSS